MDDGMPANCEFCHPPQEDDQYILLVTNHWCVYLANNQNYPGRCIIPLRRHCSTLAELTEREWLDFHKLVKALETIWREELGATNFNWTCLMNGGYASRPYIPHVHFHFIPRYDKPFETSDGAFVDTRFGNHYELSADYQLGAEDRSALCKRLRERLQAKGGF